MAAIERRTKRYPTDLTDEEWALIAPLLPPPAKRGRKPEVDLREVLNAIRYMTRTGGGWRMLPKDFPPWQTVYWWFRRFVRLMLFRTILEVERSAIEEEHRQQRPARLAPAQMGDRLHVELVHHPVDLLKGKADAKVFLEPAHAAPLAVGVGDACHHHVEQRVV